MTVPREGGGWARGTPLTQFSDIKLDLMTKFLGRSNILAKYSL